MKKVLIQNFSIILILLFLGGCTSPDSAVPTIAVPSPEISTPTTVEVLPDEGFGNVTGSVVDSITNNPLINTPVFLAPVIRDESTSEGVFALDTGRSPYAETDDAGRFLFTSIEPGDYVIVFGNVEVNRYAIVQDSDADSPVIYTIVADQILDTGTLPVPGLDLYLAENQNNVDPYPAPQQEEEQGYPDPDS